MKTRLFCASAALLLACTLPMNAGAVEAAAGAAQIKSPPAAQASAPQKEEVLYPVDVQFSPDGLTCKKIYDVPKTLSPDKIPQDDFERGSLHYVAQDILRIEMPDVDRRMHSENVTVSSSSDNSNDVMALLPKSKAVQTEDGYSGTAYLDVSSISTKVAGRESVSRNLTATREYPNLRDMDMTNIPKTIKENGNTLSFSNIDWKSSNEETDNLGTTETLYTAVVTYTGAETSSRTTGYTITATYAGEISHRNNESMRYIVVYTGSPAAEEPDTSLIAPPSIEDMTASEPLSTSEQNKTLIPWELCLVLGVIIILLALRPPACRKMVEQMKTMAAQTRNKAQQNKKEKEMQNSAKQRQKKEDNEKVREEQQIFGPLDKVKAYMRSRRQRKAEKRQAMLALVTPQAEENEEWWEDEPVDGADTSEDYTYDQNEEAMDSIPYQQAYEDGAQYDNGSDYDDDDEFPGISD